MRTYPIIAPIVLLAARPLSDRLAPTIVLLADGAAPRPSDAPGGVTLADALLTELPQLSRLTAGTAASAADPAMSTSALAAAIEQLGEVGVDRSDVAAIVGRRPKSALTLLVRQQLPELLDALATANISDVGALVRAQPRVLALDARRLSDAVRFLEGYVGAGRVGEFVALHPQALLWRDTTELPVAAHLRALGLSKSVIERVRKGMPTLDALVSADNVAALLEYLQTDLALPSTALGHLLSSYPQLLGLSLATNVKPTVTYLASLGVPVAKTIRRHPQLLGLSLDSNLKPTVAFLADLGVDVGR